MDAAAAGVATSEILLLLLDFFVYNKLPFGQGEA